MSTFADLPVVALNGVDDRYPPQKKSFMMLHYMYEHYIDKFEWFLRADDDVFIKPDKLEKFLRRVDSTKAQFIGKDLIKMCVEFFVIYFFSLQRSSWSGKQRRIRLVIARV